MAVTAQALVIGGLAAAILVVLTWRTLAIMRAEKGRPRGAPPGRGHTRVEAGYWSGGAGGGHDGHFDVPRDPQAYARRFVPRDRRQP
jgi:hypothetical protein